MLGMGKEGVPLDGVHDCAFQTIRKCDVDIRKALYANVVLAGGTATIEGFHERMAR